MRTCCHKANSCILRHQISQWWIHSRRTFQFIYWHEAIFQINFDRGKFLPSFKYVAKYVSWVLETSAFSISFVFETLLRNIWSALRGGNRGNVGVNPPHRHSWKSRRKIVALRLLHMMNVRFSLLNMAQRILGVTLPNF
jgi:hypothetical protein